MNYNERNIMRHSLAVIALLFVICGLLIAVSAQADSDPAPQPRICFAADEWGPAPNSERPCYTIERLYEDGSGAVLLGSAGHPAKARCVVPNVTEERGTFSIQCQRIGGPNR